MRVNNLSLVPGILVVGAVVCACAPAAGAASCSANVATVGSAPISRAQFNRLLRYTVGFYEHGSPASPYYGREICGQRHLASTCASIKRNLLRRLIDQQIVTSYAARHNLLPTSGDLIAALREEQHLIRDAGGQAAFTAYLIKVGTDSAQLRYLEDQQVETRKVIATMGQTRFRSWLRRQERSKAVTRCPV